MSLFLFIVIAIVGLIIGVVNYCDKEEEYVLEVDGTENGHDYVVLGLSVKWATCNVGADYPEESGDYFVWGETSPKTTDDNVTTYKWWQGSSTTLTKYCTDSDYGTVDNKIQLDLSDDAAHANWGGFWRMPTYAEFTELREKCSWIWTSKNGVEGYKVTSKTNGNSIFLPAFGNIAFGAASWFGNYWSSSLCTDESSCAWNVFFESDHVVWTHQDRYGGYPVRPVCP